MKKLLILLVSGMGLYGLAPTITSVMNAASNLNPALPNSTIAQGSLFIIKGTGMGPGTLAFDPTPFQNTILAGTSVAVNVGGTTVFALMYYTSATQLAALLPSNTPVGGGTASPATISVTYNGITSATTPFRGVVANNLHLFTVDTSGKGPAIVTYPDYSLVSTTPGSPCGGPYTACGAANPGDILILWGTGLGPVSGKDEAGAGLGQNMPGIPLVVWIGGVQATVGYRGRSGCCIGLDQIVITVPNNVPTGCNVPLTAQINNQISNTTVIAVAIGSRTCQDASFPGSSAVLSQSSATSVAVGDIGLEKNGNGASFQDIANFVFYKFYFKPGLSVFFLSAIEKNPAPGTCLVLDDSNPGNLSYYLMGTSFPDGGPMIRVTGPNGAVNVPYNGGNNVTISQAGTFLGPGTFNITGIGGFDVQAFNTAITIPPSPTLVSPTSGNNLSITRSAGITFNWTGGGAGSIRIDVQAAPDQFPTQTATARCIVPASAQTFTIPGYVMLALPASTNAQVFVGAVAPPVQFQPTGIATGNLHSQVPVGGFGGLTLN